MPKHQEYSEPELIAGCIANNRVHQEQLFRKFFPVMMRLCARYTSDQDLALAIVNAGFLKVFQKMHTFHQQGSLEGWIRRIVFRCLADHFRANARQAQVVELDGHDAPNQRAEGLQDLFYEDILLLVDRLPEERQKVFRYFAIEGYSHAEIGVMLNISEGTSKWHLSLARQQLRAMINDHQNRANYAG